MLAHHTVSPDLDTLIALFYDAPEQLGIFRHVQGPQMPLPYRTLLDHQHHMTVTVEKFHGSLVDVRVLDKQVTPTHYSRKILLARQSDKKIVQFGIVRLHLQALSEPVRNEILAEGTPLGRVLIQHNVMRQIQLSALWHVTPGEDLSHYFGMQHGQFTYGRTAMIHCDGQPAIELLEIVSPV